MKKVRLITIFLIALFALLGTTTEIYARTSVEIKPGTDKPYTNLTISEFFAEAQNMKNVGEGLAGAGSNVDVHMANNLEWATVAYFANSEYGAGSAALGVTTDKNANGNVSGLKLEGTNYFTTNGNVTGIMDFGKTITYTAGIISNYANITDETIRKNGENLIAQVGSKYVDVFTTNDSETKKYGQTGWYCDVWHYRGSDINLPYVIRSGLFGFIGGVTHYSGGRTSGAAWSDVTFRPVITVGSNT